MRTRLDLQKLLEELLGSPNVYFAPPNGYQIKYPCIIYNLVREDTSYADNLPYSVNKCYNIKVIDRNPDSLIPDKVSRLPLCSFDRTYRSEGLVHTTYNLYF